MAPDADDAALDIAQLRHDRNAALTIVQGRTELLQRQPRRRDGVPDADRQWLTKGLTDSLAATRTLVARVNDRPLGHERQRRTRG